MGFQFKVSYRSSVKMTLIPKIRSVCENKTENKAGKILFLSQLQLRAEALCERYNAESQFRSA